MDVNDSIKLTANQCSVLQTIKRHDQISRVDLCSEVGLTNGAITRLTRELMLLGLIEEGQKILGNRGQPAKPLNLSAGGGLSCGISFSLNSLEFVTTNFAGQVVSTKIRKLVEPDPIEIAALTKSLIQEVLETDDSQQKRFFGLGVAVPAIFSSDNEFNTSPWFDLWQDPNTKKILRSEFDCPVWYENTGTAAAMAESFVGSTGQASVSFVIYISQGLGGGLVINGRPFRGAFGNACEVSSVFPFKEGPRPSVRDLLSELGLELQSRNEVEVIQDVWYSGDESLRRWTTRAGQQLTELATRISHFYDPEVIVLSGRLPAQVLAELAGLVSIGISDPKSWLPERRVSASKLGSSIAAIGAACIPTLDFIGARPLGRRI